LLQSGVSTLQSTSPIKATSTKTTTVTIMWEPTLYNWRRTKTTKGRSWIVPPLDLKATTPPIPVFSTRGRTPSKLTTYKLSRPTTKTMTSCKKLRLITSMKTKLVPLLSPNWSDRFHSSSRVPSSQSTLFSPSQNCVNNGLTPG
jgi:hypothetical protein